MSTKMNAQFLLILLACYLSAVRANDEKKVRVCSMNQIKQVLDLICPDIKRTNHYSSEVKNNRLTLWKNIFHMNDNTLVTIPEISYQIELLFDRCNDHKKTTGLKRLLTMYKAKEYHKNSTQKYTNDRLTNYLNEKPSNENENGEIIKECCMNACRLKDLKNYCIVD